MDQHQGHDHFWIWVCIVFLAVFACSDGADSQTTVYDYKTMFVYTGDTATIFVKLVNPDSVGKTATLDVYQWENEQHVAQQVIENLQLDTEPSISFVPPRVGHYVVQMRVDGNLVYDSRLSCPDPCVGPWWIYAWPKGVVGEGTIE